MCDLVRRECLFGFYNIERTYQNSDLRESKLIMNSVKLRTIIKVYFYEMLLLNYFGVPYFF